jgi:hypothetical protein
LQFFWLLSISVLIQDENDDDDTNKHRPIKAHQKINNKTDADYTLNNYQVTKWNEMKTFNLDWLQTWWKLKSLLFNSDHPQCYLFCCVVYLLLTTAFQFHEKFKLLFSFFFIKWLHLLVAFFGHEHWTLRRELICV